MQKISIGLLCVVVSWAPCSWAGPWSSLFFKSRPLISKIFRPSGVKDFSSLPPPCPSTPRPNRCSDPSVEVASLIKRTQSANSREFSQILENLAHIKRENSRLRLSQPSVLNLLSSAKEHLRTSSLRNLSSVLHSFGILGITPSDAYFSDWMGHWKDLNSPTAQDLVTSLYGFAQMGKHPGSDFMQNWEKQASRLLAAGEWREKELSNTLFCYVLLDLDLRMLWPQLEKSLMQLKGPIPTMGLHQLHWVRTTIHQKYQFELPLAVSEAIDKAIPVFQAQLPHESMSQIEVLKELQWIYGDEVKNEAWLALTASYVDFYFPSRNLVVQFNGPHHYNVQLDGSEVLRPKDRIKGTVLESAGVKVILFSYRQKAQMQSWTESQKKAFWIDQIGLPKL